jgi:hypothetical protein
MKTRILILACLLGCAAAQTEPKPAGGGEKLPPGVEYALVLPRSVLVNRHAQAQLFADLLALGALYADGDPVLAKRAQGRADVLAELLAELDRKTEGEKP